MEKLDSEHTSISRTSCFVSERQNRLAPLALMRNWILDTLKPLKNALRQNEQFLQSFFEYLLDNYLPKDNVIVRLYTVLLIDEIFRRSHRFRECVVDNFEVSSNVLATWKWFWSTDTFTAVCVLKQGAYAAGKPGKPGIVREIETHQGKPGIVRENSTI